MKKIGLSLITFAMFFLFNVTLFSCSSDDDGESKIFYTVSFNSKGGTSVNSVKVESGKTVKKPIEPTKTGCTFDGWFYDDDGYTREFDFSKSIEKDMVLFSKWRLNPKFYEGSVDGIIPEIQKIYEEAKSYGVKNNDCYITMKITDEIVDYCELDSILHNIPNIKMCLCLDFSRCSEVNNTKTSFRDWFMWSNFRLTVREVIFPDSLEKLDIECLYAEKIHLPNNLIELNCNFFEDPKLREINIPKSLKKGSINFEECENLTGDFDFEHVKDFILHSDLKVLNEFGPFGLTKVNSVKFPDNLKEIVKECFNGCGNLTYVKFPNSLEKIGVAAFKGCEKLSTLELPNSLKTIDGFAFSNCKNLSNIVIPDSVNFIGERAFYNINGVTFASNSGWLYDSDKTVCNDPVDAVFKGKAICKSN